MAKKLFVVLNKVDLIPEDIRVDKIDKMKKALIKNVFSKTRFPNPPIVAVCAAPNQGKDADEKSKILQQESLKELIEVFKRHVELPPDEVAHDKVGIHKLRNKFDTFKQPFLFAVDHCFAIKGKGTVLTGTVLQGTVSLEQNVEIPSLNEQRKVKSLQMFKKPVKSAKTGDRIGVLVTQLESSRFERGFVAGKATLSKI